MERLTIKLENGEADLKTSSLKDSCEYCHDAIQKLAGYEDLEEQGVLLRLPVAEGTTIYMISNNTECCGECDFFEEGYWECEDECRKLDDRPNYPQYADEPICDKQFLEVSEYTPNLDWIFNSRKQFGKTIFLTKAKAEKALAEMKKQIRI